MDIGLILSSYNNIFNYYIQQLFNIWKTKSSINILVSLDLKSNETINSVNDAITIIKNAQELGAKIIVDFKEWNSESDIKKYTNIFGTVYTDPTKADIILNGKAGLEQAMLILRKTTKYYKLYKDETNDKQKC
jgi:hypothetical protein